MRIVFLFIVAALCSMLAAAQTAPAPHAAPSPDQMIEQLRSPRTRSLRNLQVEAVQPAASAATSASTAASALPATTPATAINTATAAAAPLAAAAQTPVAAPTPASILQTAPERSTPASLSLLIQFDFDSARVKPQSLQALANLAIALKSDDLKTARFAVEGHTDAQGRADYNQRLSQIRAEAVSSYLSSQGVARERLQASGKGASELANRADPAAAENRRVRIVNLD